MTPWLEVCRAAAADIKTVLAELPTRVEREPVPRFGLGGDDTTAIDAAAEAVAAAAGAARRGLHARLEELGERTFNGGGSIRVVCDPIDGSLNAKRDIRSSRCRSRSPTGRRWATSCSATSTTSAPGRSGRRSGGGAFRNGERLGDVRPGLIEILSFEATTTAQVADKAAQMVKRVPARIMGSLALSLCHLAAACRRSAAQAACSVDIAAASCSCASAVSRSTCSSDLPFDAALLDLVGRSASSRRERRSCAGRRGHDHVGCSGWNCTTAGGTASSIRNDCQRGMARALRRPFRHRRGQRDLLPPADREGGPGLGRPDTRPLRLQRQAEPLRHAREAAARAGAEPGALLRAARATGTGRQARPRPLAAAADLPPRRRAPREAPALRRGSPLHRVPARELVRARRDGAAARARRRARDRRPPRGARLPEPRLDRGLGLRALPPRPPRRAWQLLGVGAAGVGRADPRLARLRGVRLLQQRLGRLCAQERTPAPRTSGTPTRD